MKTRPLTVEGERPSAGLTRNVLSAVDSVTLALAGTAPAYSLTASTAVLVATVGLAAPAALLYGALPMLGIALAFLYLNRWRDDAGSTYTWVGRALHPALGFLSGWSLVVCNVLFMVAGSLPLGTTTLHLLAPRWEANVPAATAVSAAWFVAVAVPLFFGLRVTARLQKVMTAVEVVGLLLVVGGMAVHLGHHPARAFSWGWFSPHAFGTGSGFMAGMLVAVFYYCGWDVSANLAEETRDSKRAPGMGGLLGVLGIFLLFLLSQTVFQMGLTDSQIQAFGPDLIPRLGDLVLPRPWGGIAVLAVLVSTLATLETGILQAGRTLYAMGRDRVISPRFADLHPRLGSPWLATLVVGLAGLALFVLSSFSASVGALMGSLINAVGLQIVFSYSLAGLACAWFYRRTLLSGAGAFVLRGLWPAASAVFLLAVAAFNVRTLDWKTDVLSLGAIAAGVVPLVVCRRKYRSAFYSAPREQAAHLDAAPSDPRRETHGSARRAA